MASKLTDAQKVKQLLDVIESILLDLKTGHTGYARDRAETILDEYRLKH